MTVASRRLASGGFSIARDRMVARLASRGICDARVLAAMRAVPRHLFVAEALASKAYGESALPIGEGQTISQPWAVARMSELLGLRPDEKVLEVGSGSGYQTAVLSHLARHVYSVERIAALARGALQILGQLEIGNASVKVFDGTFGWGEWAPYPAILVTAAAPEIPAPLLEQLAPGGRLVAPLGEGREQSLVRVTRTERGDRYETLDRVSFVPLRGRFGLQAGT